MSHDELMDLQRAILDQGYTWSAGPTPLSALPPQEQTRRLGLRLEPEQMARIARRMAEPFAVVAEFPPAWDWRDGGGADWTTSIRDQKACGSCVAFATVAVLEAMFKLHLQDASSQPDLSEAHLFFCGCGNCCDQGWWPTYALDYARSNGVPGEACFPYQDHDLPCSESCADWQSQAAKAASWEEVLDVGARKAWLATKGPMVGCMAVYSDFFAYTGGVYRPTTNQLAGYHAVCVVGYSEAEQCWICKNSWGPLWGDSGWFRIGYGACDMDTKFAMYGVPDVVPSGPEPPPPSPDGCNLVKRALQALKKRLRPD